MRGIIDNAQQERMRAQVAELCEDLQRNVCLVSDRLFIKHIKNMLNARNLTVAEADRIASIYGNYVAYVKNEKVKHEN